MCICIGVFDRPVRVWSSTVVFLSLLSLSSEPALGVLQSVLDAAVEGCSVLHLCELGDRLILEETGKVYKREKEMKKGECSITRCGTTFSIMLANLITSTFISRE